MAYAVRPLSFPAWPLGAAANLPFEAPPFVVIGSIHTPAGQPRNQCDVYGPVQLLRKTDPLLQMFSPHTDQKHLYIRDQVNAGRKNRILVKDIACCGPFVVKDRYDLTPELSHTPPNVTRVSPTFSLFF